MAALQLMGAASHASLCSTVPLSAFAKVRCQYRCHDKWGWQTHALMCGRRRRCTSTVICMCWEVTVLVHGLIIEGLPADPHLAQTM